MLYNELDIKTAFLYFVSWYINFRGLFNLKFIHVKEQQWYCLTCSFEDKGFIPYSSVLVRKYTQ